MAPAIIAIDHWYMRKFDLGVFSKILILDVKTMVHIDKFDFIQMFIPTKI